jgi:hypothetical protein
MQIGLPITGKYRDQDSDQYYNNSDVSSWHTGMPSVAVLGYCTS